jgi:transcriptional/translational regulatory protein YebC/TACO1
VLDAGAEEVNDLGEEFEVICEAADLPTVRGALDTAGISIDSADTAFLPSVSVPLADETGRKVLRLVDALEDSDDVQNVWANFDVSDDVLESA